MRPENDTTTKECSAVHELFTDYLDNTLSARQVWQVEKHLAACAACAELAREMRAAVQLMRMTPRFDTGDDFMAKLHARLDTLEPEAMRPSATERVRDWVAGIGEALRIRRTPALGLGFSVVALAGLLVVFPRNTVAPPVTSPNSGSVRPQPPVFPEADRSVALSASNPLEDPAAANLVVHTASATTDAHAAVDEVNSVLEADGETD